MPTFESGTGEAGLEWDAAGVRLGSTAPWHVAPQPLEEGQKEGREDTIFI